MHFQTIDRGVHWEFGYWVQTIERWHEEGLPKEITSHEGRGSVEAYFGVDPKRYVPISIYLDPPFSDPVRVLEEKENSRVVEHPDGMIAEEGKGSVVSIPKYIKMPISGRDDWKRFKDRLDPYSPARERDWAAIGEKTRQSQVPVGVDFGSFFGWIRDWVGFEQLALMMYDDPELVEEMVETLTEVKLVQLEACLRECQLDFASGWEDICFRGGPMISPAMFRDIVGPPVKRVCDLLRQHGVDVIWTDCDGDIRPLVPIWLEAGLNCMFPLEVHCGSDPVALREQYGRQILLRGGLEKYRFSKGKEEILAELKRVEKVFEEGGYIPHGDHRIPPDVPYENYRYYIREKLAMMGWSKDEISEVWALA
jgi:uroporphyrinogen decarboxylase